MVYLWIIRFADRMKVDEVDKVDRVSERAGLPVIGSTRRSAEVRSCFKTVQDVDTICVGQKKICQQQNKVCN